MRKCRVSWQAIVKRWNHRTKTLINKSIYYNTRYLQWMHLPRDIFIAVFGSLAATLDPMEKPPVAGTIKGIFWYSCCFKGWRERERLTLWVFVAVKIIECEEYYYGECSSEKTTPSKIQTPRKKTQCGSLLVYVCTSRTTVMCRMMDWQHAVVFFNGCSATPSSPEIFSERRWPDEWFVLRWVHMFLILTNIRWWAQVDATTLPYVFSIAAMYVT